MIDIENEIFTKVATALRSAFTGISVSGTLVLSPEQYPAVSVEEVDNSVYIGGMDSHTNENYAEVMYEVNAFSNRVPGSKAEVKDIMATVDDVLSPLGFIRTTKLMLQGETPTHCRLVCRYRAVVSKDERIYGR